MRELGNKRWNSNKNGIRIPMVAQQVCCIKKVKVTSGCWLQVVMPIMPIFNCQMACMLKIPASMKGLARYPIRGSSPIRCTNCGMRLIIPSQAYRATRMIRWLRHSVFKSLCKVDAILCPLNFLPINSLVMNTKDFGVVMKSSYFLGRPITVWLNTMKRSPSLLWKWIY